MKCKKLKQLTEDILETSKVSPWNYIKFSVPITNMTQQSFPLETIYLDCCNGSYTSYMPSGMEQYLIISSSLSSIINMDIIISHSYTMTISRGPTSGLLSISVSPYLLHFYNVLYIEFLLCLGLA